MPKFAFSGVLDFFPADRAEAINTARRSQELARLGSALGQCAEHDDPEVQRSILVEARRQREILAAHLKAADAAIASVEARIEPPAKAEEPEPAKAPAKGPSK